MHYIKNNVVGNALFESFAVFCSTHSSHLIVLVDLAHVVPVDEQLDEASLAVDGHRLELARPAPRDVIGRRQADVAELGEPRVGVRLILAALHVTHEKVDPLRWRQPKTGVKGLDQAPMHYIHVCLV